MHRSYKKLYVLIGVTALALGVFALSGCGAKSPQAASNKNETTQKTSEQGILKIGTLQTDDLLPLWVAQEEGLLKQAGINVDIQTFQSAQEQIAAVTAGDIDGIMTDMVVPLQLTSGGTPMKALTIMQGAPAGIVASKASGITKVAGLSGVKAGCSSATAMEYIYDTALKNAGVAEGKIQIEEIKKLPVRFELLNSGKIDAAVLPWTFFTLAQKQGATPVLDSTQAANITSTVLEFRSEVYERAGAAKTMKKLITAWNVGVEKINAQPDAYRALLAQKASLPAALKTTYPVRTYPAAELPDKTQFSQVNAWMVGKGYAKKSFAYDELVYRGAGLE